MGLQIGGVDHDRRLLAVISRQADHHLGKDAFVAPPFPTVMECLVRAIFLGRISPPQAIAIDEDNATQDAPSARR